MTEDQKILCAIALFANGYNRPQAAKVLGENEDRVQELVEAGADAQRDGYMGFMKSSVWAEGDPEVTYTGWHGTGPGWDGTRPGDEASAKRRPRPERP